MTETIYQAAGGAEGMRRLAHAWHARVMADEAASHPFSHGFRPDHSERLAAYLGEALGGPPLYSTTMAHETAVQRIHAGNGEHVDIDDGAIAAWVLAVDDLGFGDPLRQVLIDYWVAGVARMNEHPDPPDTVPDGLAIPRWSWDGLSTD